MGYGQSVIAAGAFEDSSLSGLMGLISLPIPGVSCPLFYRLETTQRRLSGGGKNLSWILKGTEGFGSRWERHARKSVLRVQGQGSENLVVNGDWFLGGDICKSVVFL